MRHKPNPNLDDVELASVRKRLTTAGLGLWQEAEASAGLALDGETRLSVAIRSVEQTATAGERELVAGIHATLREMPSFDADDVRDLLNVAGVPDVLTTRRRLASMCVNGLPGKRKLGTRMTRHATRSGRPITVWTCQPEGNA